MKQHINALERELDNLLDKACSALRASITGPKTERTFQQKEVREYTAKARAVNEAITALYREV